MDTSCDVLRRLAAEHPGLDGTTTVLGLGAKLATALGFSLHALREFPSLDAQGIAIPSTQHDLYVWLRGDDQGELFLRARCVEQALRDAFVLASDIDTFVYDIGRDLTGYEDGTENPQGQAAVETAIVADPSVAPLASSFVAVQNWEHDFERFAAMTKSEQDFAIGRERLSNEELDDAPESAHVKRTAQESFDPESFVLRRSTPWTNGKRGGLLFVAFGATLDPFERQLRRMAGLDDGIVDGLFQFSRPVSGAYYWCPPLEQGRIVLID